MAESYLHGYSPEEQRRLLAQADFLAPWVYGGLPIPPRGTLLEVGAGVGAQTVHLLRRTAAKVVAVERDRRQFSTLRAVLREPIAQGRVQPLRGDARQLPLATGSLDGAFVCWVLEHIPGPGAVLAEIGRVLKPGSPALFTEVQNQSLTVLPPEPGLSRYWSAMNQVQARMGGDPFIGARLPGLLALAGFQEIESTFVPVHGDARDPVRRREILTYFQGLLSSSVATVESAGEAWETMKADLEAAYQRLMANDAAVSLYTFARVTAVAPGHA